jgi:hypothetical protein
MLPLISFSLVIFYPPISISRSAVLALPAGTDHLTPEACVESAVRIAVLAPTPKRATVPAAVATTISPLAVDSVAGELRLK